MYGLVRLRSLFVHCLIHLSEFFDVKMDEYLPRDPPHTHFFSYRAFTLWLLFMWEYPEFTKVILNDFFKCLDVFLTRNKIFILCIVQKIQY